MRKSINVETVTSALVNTYRAKLWRGKVEELVKSVAVASTDYVNGYQQKLKGEIEFANANLELLSENDYNWLLEQQKSPTDIIELPPKTHGVRETYNKSDTEIMDKFKSVLDKCATKNVDKFKSNNVALNIALAADKLKVGDAVTTESQTKLWVIQVTNGKDVWYKSTTALKDNCVTSGVNNAVLYYTKADAEFYAKFMKAHNKGTNKRPSPVKVTVKEVVYTENASRTVELVKPVDSTVKKVRKSKKVYLIQDKKTKQYVTKVDHSNFTEVDLDKYLSEARLYVNKKLAEDDSAYLSRYKDKNCKAQLEVVEMLDDEKFVLWSNGSLEFFVRIDSTGIRTTKNIDEATRYVSYKSASTAVKKTDKELPYRFSISTVKNVKPLVVPVEKPVKKVKEPKVKEEWVLYDVTTGKNLYYRGDSVTSSWYLTDKLEEAKKFPTYSSAVKVNYKLVNLGYANFSLSESKDFE